MARKSDGEKSDELEKIVAALTERLEDTSNSLAGFHESHKQAMATMADLRRESEREIALLKREMEDLNSWREDYKKERVEAARRLWAFGPNVLDAVNSGLIGAAVAYFVARR